MHDLQHKIIRFILQGDGGSPLVCKDTNSQQYIQVGIVAWGIGCGPNLPAAYVNVPLVTPWILKKLQENHLDTNYSSLNK
jgi:kallikrein